MKLTLLAASALLLSACAGQPRCNAEAHYRKAAAVPPVQAAEGLVVPESPSALRVPALTPEAKAAAEHPLPRKGSGSACLDYPPELEPIDTAESSTKR